VTEGELIEHLAALEHDRWAHWQKYVHSQGVIGDDGALTMPAELVMRWERQIATPYHDLSSSEKESDREQVKKVLPFIERYIAAQ